MKSKIHCHNPSPRWTKPQWHKRRPKLINQAISRISKATVEYLPGVLAQRRVYNRGRKIRSEMCSLLPQAISGMLHYANIASGFHVWASMKEIAKRIGATIDRVSDCIVQLERAMYVFCKRSVVKRADGTVEKRVTEVRFTRQFFIDLGFAANDIQSAVDDAREQQKQRELAKLKRDQEIIDRVEAIRHKMMQKQLNKKKAAQQEKERKTQLKREMMIEIEKNVNDLQGLGATFEQMKEYKHAAMQALNEL